MRLATIFVGRMLGSLGIWVLGGFAWLAVGFCWWVVMLIHRSRRLR
jgi:hypothetical protein